jgi:hypothetical protein
MQLHLAGLIARMPGWRGSSKGWSTTLDAEVLPFCPRYLSRTQSAAYVGVCPNTFDLEVKAGMWPMPMRRGGKQGRVTWDIKLLDRAADLHSGLLGAPIKEAEPVIELTRNDPAYQEALDRLKSRVRTPKHRRGKSAQTGD